MNVILNIYQKGQVAFNIQEWVTLPVFFAPLSILLSSKGLAETCAVKNHGSAAKW